MPRQECHIYSGLVGNSQQSGMNVAVCAAPEGTAVDEVETAWLSELRILSVDIRKQWDGWG